MTGVSSLASLQIAWDEGRSMTHMRPIGLRGTLAQLLSIIEAINNVVRSIFPFLWCFCFFLLFF